MKRIFISSTFKDMQYERDVLREVAAKLDAEAFKRGDGVSLCDLRSGVNTLELDSEAGAAKVLEVCLDEIDRCRPYMIVLLGNRYGWVPGRRQIERVLRGHGHVPNVGHLSVTALEIEYGALLNPDQMDRTMFYFREPDPSEPRNYGPESKSHAVRLAALKTRIASLGGRIRSYRLSWESPQCRPAGLTEFANLVEQDLRELLQRDWREAGISSRIRRAERIHMGLAKSLSARYPERRALFQRCLDVISGGSIPAFAVQGGSGTGKTTLLGQLSGELERQGWDVLPIFCGATMDSNDAKDVAKAIVRHCAPRTALPDGAADNWETWTQLLGEALAKRATNGRRLAVLVDGIDQLADDEGRAGLLFVPPVLPPGVRMVLSGLDTFDFTGRIPAIQIAGLDREELVRLFGSMANERGAELDRTVRCEIMKKRAIRNPLYLGLLRLRLDLMDREDFTAAEVSGGGMEGISNRQREIVKHCPESLAGLCTEMIGVAERLLKTKWVRFAMTSIAVSRHGLRESDMASIFKAEKLPWTPLDFARFRTFLRPFFLERDDGRIDFVHQSFRRGFLRHARMAARCRSAVLQRFAAIEGQDVVRDEEYEFLCRRSGRPGQFLGFLGKYVNSERTMSACAKSFLSGLLEDGGDFAEKLTKAAVSPEDWMSFCDFVNFHVCDTMGGNPVQRALMAALLERLIAKGRQLGKEARGVQAFRRQTGVLCRCLGNLFKENGSAVGRRKALAYFRAARRCFEQKPSAWGRASEDEFRDIIAILLDLGELYEESTDGRSARSALDNYLEAYRYERKLSGRFGKAASQDVLFRILYYLGDWHFRYGDADDDDLCLSYYKRAVKTFEDAKRMGNSYLREREKSVCYSRLSQVCFRRGSRSAMREGVKWGERALEIDDRTHWAKRSPDSIRDCMAARMVLSNAYIGLGGASHLARAKALCLDVVALGRRWMKLEPSPDAMHLLAQGYGELANAYQNLGGKANRTMALDFYRKSVLIFSRLGETGLGVDCLMNLSCSYYNMGVLFSKAGGRRNLIRAKDYLEKGQRIDNGLFRRNRTGTIAENLVSGALLLGDVCRKLGGADTLKMAVREYRRAARFGSAEACFALGEMYDAGLGVAKNAVRARDWHKRAYAAGYRRNSAVRRKKKETTERGGATRGGEDGKT